MNPPRSPHARRPQQPAPEEFCATIVLRSATTKPDALAVVALVVDGAVQGAGTLHPRVALADGAWVEVELPKTGEPPPLAIDVYSSISADHARLVALELLARLHASTAWRLRADFPV